MLLKWVSIHILKWLTSASHFKIHLCYIPIIIFSKQIGTYLEAEEHLPVKITHFNEISKVIVYGTLKKCKLQISKCLIYLLRENKGLWLLIQIWICLVFFILSGKRRPCWKSEVKLRQWRLQCWHEHYNLGTISANIIAA